MPARLRLRSCAWTLGAVAILAAAACGSADRVEQVSTAGFDAATTATTAATATIGGFAACDDIADVDSTLEGNRRTGKELPEEVFYAVLEYGEAHHSDQFGFVVDNGRIGGPIVAFTGDLEAHRDAIAALLPDGTPFDVVKVDYSHEELRAVRDSIGRLQGLQGIGTWTMRNRVALDFVDPTDATLDQLAELAPADMVCLNVIYSVEPPSGSLDIIPLDSSGDTPTDCWWGGYGLSTTECENRIVLPPGLGHVAVHLNRGALPDPADTSIRLLVKEADCTSGREMGDALRGPQVIETDDVVLVAFAVVPHLGMANCPGNPDARVTIELSRPLGDRALLNGVLVPPEPITTRPDR